MRSHKTLLILFCTFYKLLVDKYKLVCYNKDGKTLLANRKERKMKREDRRTVTTLHRRTKYGYTEVANFVKDEYAQGGSVCYLRRYEKWDDGHITYPQTGKIYEEFPNANFGNQRYKDCKEAGYVFVEVRSFKPTEMEMR